MACFMERKAEELQLLQEEKDSTNNTQNTKAVVKLLHEYCSVVKTLYLYALRCVVTNQLLQGGGGSVTWD